MEGGDGGVGASLAPLDALAGAAELQQQIDERQARALVQASAASEPQAFSSGGDPERQAGDQMGAKASVGGPAEAPEAQQPPDVASTESPGRSDTKTDVVGPSQSTEEGEAVEQQQEKAERRASSRRKKAPVVYGEEDSEEDKEARVPSKKRAQKALKPPSAAPVRASKRSRVVKTYAAPSSGTESNDEQPKPASRPPQQPRSRKRQQRPGSPQSAAVEPPPIIDDVPPLPFTDSPQRKAPFRSRSPAEAFGGASTSRKCEFCMHATDMCVLLICSACKRAYHSRCLVQTFKPFWPSEGTTEERLQKMLEFSDRRVNFLRCGSCRAVFGEFADVPDEFLQSCKCPTCVRPELLASFRCLKIKQMLIEWDEMKEKQRKKKSAKSTTAAANICSDTSTGNNSSERASTGESGTSAIRSSASRRKSSRPLRITRGNSKDIGESDPVVDPVNNSSLPVDSSVQADTSIVEAVADMTLTDTTNENVLKQPEDVEMIEANKSIVEQKVILNQDAGIRQLEEDGEAAMGEQAQSSLGEMHHPQSPKSASKKRPRPLNEALAEASGSFSDFAEPQNVNGINVKSDGEFLRFRAICTPFRAESQNADFAYNKEARTYSAPKLSAVVAKSGHFGWKPKHPGRVYCVCCKLDMSPQVFLEHCNLSKGLDVKEHMFAVHGDEVSCTPLNRFIKALRYKYSPKQATQKKPGKKPGKKSKDSKLKPDVSPVIEAPIDPAILAERIPRKSEIPKIKEMIALEVACSDGEKLPEPTPAELTKASQRVERVVIRKRNWQSKLSESLQAADHANDKLDFLVQVVSLEITYVKKIPGKEDTLRDSMHNMPADAAKRKVGWRALNTRGRLGRSIFCECCEVAMPTRKFIEHNDLPRRGECEKDLYVAELTQSWIQQFLAFRADAKLLGRADGEKSLGSMLALVPEYPSSPTCATPVGLELASQW